MYPIPKTYDGSGIGKKIKTNFISGNNRIEE
jgi:hypothetical protein